jgi:hypothetical protein
VTTEYCLDAIIALASYTGWSEDEMMRMPTSRFLAYVGRLPKKD